MRAGGCAEAPLEPRERGPHVAKGAAFPRPDRQPHPGEAAQGRGAQGADAGAHDLQLAGARSPAGPGTGVSLPRPPAAWQSKQRQQPRATGGSGRGARHHAARPLGQRSGGSAARCGGGGGGGGEPACGTRQSGPRPPRPGVLGHHRAVYARSGRAATTTAASAVYPVTFPNTISLARPGLRAEAARPRGGWAGFGKPGRRGMQRSPGPAPHGWRQACQRRSQSPRCSGGGCAGLACLAEGAASGL
mmetsp:Transcript_48123/g.150628  ORF Transcript_48123/g.150628 Transcript_48123/m.150628 type:complete len:246 (+) Transcript_48123:238-975(+)